MTEKPLECCVACRDCEAWVRLAEIVMEVGLCTCGCSRHFSHVIGGHHPVCGWFEEREPIQPITA